MSTPTLPEGGAATATLFALVTLFLLRARQQNQLELLKQQQQAKHKQPSNLLSSSEHTHSKAIETNPEQQQSVEFCTFDELAAREKTIYSRLNYQRKSRLVFLGTGCSGGTPLLGCLLGVFTSKPRGGCLSCRIAHADSRDKNHRGNPCMLIQGPARLLPDEDPQQIPPDRCNVLIDCGKTFIEAALRFFPLLGVRGIDSIIITHEHADAIFGLDEIRLVQRVMPDPNARPSKPPEELAKIQLDAIRKVCREETSIANGLLSSAIESDPPSPSSLSTHVKHGKKGIATHPLTDRMVDCVVHASTQASHHLERAMPYLFDKHQTEPGNIKRFVAKFHLEPFELSTSKTFEVRDFFPTTLPANPLSLPVADSPRAIPTITNSLNLEESLVVTPLPVWHGPNYLAAGFEFGRKHRVVYISDVSSIPDDVQAFLSSSTKPQIEILVIDALRPTHIDPRRPAVHFDLRDALRTARALGPPKRTLIVGMGHEFEHETTNQALQTLPVEHFGIVQLAFDGLVVEGLDL